MIMVQGWTTVNLWYVTLNCSIKYWCWAALSYCSYKLLEQKMCSWNLWQMTMSRLWMMHYIEDNMCLQCCTFSLNELNIMMKYYWSCSLFDDAAVELRFIFLQDGDELLLECRWSVVHLWKIGLCENVETEHLPSLFDKLLKIIFACSAACSPWTN